MTTRTPIDGPTAWSTDTITVQDLTVDVPADCRDDLAAIGAEITRRGLALADLSPDMFAVPGLAGLAERIRSMLFAGPGAVIVRGWPLGEGDENLVSALYWGLGSVIGTPRGQNSKGDRVKLVTRRDALPAANLESARRGSRSNSEIDFHTENARPPVPPRIVGLLCLRNAAQGGESLVISGHSVYNALLAEDNPALERLCEDFYFARSEPYDDGRVVDAEPVFRRDGDRLAVRFNRYWMDRGHEDAEQPLTEDARALAAVDAFEAVLGEKNLALEHLMQPGEILFVNNSVVLHKRNAFQDFEEVDRRRCLVRIWID